MSIHKIEVSRTPEGQVHVVKGTWSDTFPEERRLTWADWYEEMHKTYAYEGYDDMAKALRALGA